MQVQSYFFARKTDWFLTLSSFFKQSLDLDPVNMYQDIFENGFFLRIQSQVA